MERTGFEPFGEQMASATDAQPQSRASKLLLRAGNRCLGVVDVALHRLRPAYRTGVGDPNVDRRTVTLSGLS